MIYRVRYNKSAGQPGRGTELHKWRVFDETNKERLCKQVILKALAWTEQDPNGVDWNMVSEGDIHIDKENSIITIL